MLKLRWELMPYTLGSGLHLGAGAANMRLLPNALYIDQVAGPNYPDVTMDLAGLPGWAAGTFKFVVADRVLTRVEKPREALVDYFRVIDEGGYLCVVTTGPRRAWLCEALGLADFDLVQCDELAPARWLHVFKKLHAGLGRHCSCDVPKPEKRAAIVRPGAYGDVLWASSIALHLKRQKYHVTVYTCERGEEMLRHDPNVDRVVVWVDKQLDINDAPKFWDHEQPKYDRWINLAEVVEKNLLMVPTDLRYYWPDAERRKLCDASYWEAMHDFAGVPRNYQVRFFESEEERAFAKKERGDASLCAVIAASGGTLPKFWPYLDELVDGLIARGFAVWVSGLTHGMHFAPRAGLHVIGTAWPMRQAMAFAKQADLVLGQDTGLLNAVSLEPMPKIVLLAGTTEKNLTQHFVNTTSLHGTPPCYPCHRIHYYEMGFKYCTPDPKTRTAACQAMVSAATVLRAVDKHGFALQAVA
jgi:ADP-heptose:LPS heptosyltransferase